jgi:lipopolysaccharide transport system ATP-binding protein
MNSNKVIEIRSVSKKFSKSLKHAIRYGITDIGKSLVGKENHRQLRAHEFWALKDISFNIKKGESIAIIGANGSGKSTLLKLLNGIFLPDKGIIKISGSVSALIGIGAGFHPMLTGKENIYLNGAIFGMSKKEIEEKFESIVTFADIGDFLATPVKNYSSGMFVRLGFSIAIHSVPDILIIDEVLAVGDENFRKKSYNKIKQIAKSNKTVIFVSHDLDAIKTLTQKAVLLKQGQIKAIGNTKKILDQYLTDQNKE